MGTTRKDLSDWFDEGKSKGATHMIVACDTFDHEDYPVFVNPGQSARQLVADKYSGQNMQRCMEVYSLKSSKSEQMAHVGRVMNFDDAPSVPAEPESDPEDELIYEIWANADRSVCGVFPAELVSLERMTNGSSEKFELLASFAAKDWREAQVVYEAVVGEEAAR